MFVPKAFATTYTSQYPPEHTSTYVKTTSEFSGSFTGYKATNPVNSLTGGWGDTSWIATTTTNQSFNIDLGEGKIIKRIYYENLHNDGGEGPSGAKTTSFWGSNSSDAFSNTTYATDTDWTELTISDTEFDQHVASNIADPKYSLVTNSISYRYYRLKFADNNGGSFLGVRRIELQTEDAEATPTPTPTSTPTPTPTPVATTSATLVTSLKGRCSFWADHAVGTNEEWYVRNDYTDDITKVTYSLLGGNGISQSSTPSGSLDVTDYGSGVPRAGDHHINFDGDFTTGKILTLRSEGTVFYVRCTYSDGTYQAFVPFGKSSASDSASLNEYGVPETCTPVVLQIPFSKLFSGVQDWEFQLPDFLCEYQKFMGQLFGVPFEQNNQAIFDNLDNTLTSKAPIAYVYTALTANWVDPNFATSTPTFTIPLYGNEYTIVDSTGLVSQAGSFIRTGLQVALWLFFLGYILAIPRKVFKS